ncbi:hypothetical protein BKA67DRAFT_587605 [Truncatella angustata]|uniref:Uncharacterized protein n=1 Tax=Truncatella angustata TaxID=152316 RepID=A0A9P8RK47_9PEZI|nr:uncharacterized protein BKA67DRAFT_587605 [Truncatella angustata]KAH6643399.1 hypothetical protein BKA67DRAFT_587605 [Truncatella angustata]
MSGSIWISENSVRVLSTSESLAQFDHIFSELSKRELVRSIDFMVVLPEVSVKRLKKLQSKAEAAANDAVFTRAVLDFFERLAKWETRGEGGSLSLTIKADSHTYTQIDELVANQTLKNTHNDFKGGIWQVRNLNKYLQFEADAPPLPEVKCITMFDFGSIDQPRELHPNVLAAVTNACVRATRVDWCTGLPQRGAMPKRREIRSALARALQQAKFTSANEIVLRLMDNDPMNEAFELESVLENPDELDSLSLAVRRVCQLPTLRKLDLDTLWSLSPVAFGAHPALPDLKCPSLEEVIINVSMTTPDGRYLMTGDPENASYEDGYWNSEAEKSPAPFDSDDSDTSDWQPEFAWDKLDGEVPPTNFRSTPDPDTFVPLAQSFARAAFHHMPKLRSMEINFGGMVRACSSPSELLYFAPGQPHRRASDYLGDCEKFDKENTQCPRWYFDGTLDFDSSWRMPQELKRELEGPDGNGRIYMTVEQERIEI